MDLITRRLSSCSVGLEWNHTELVIRTNCTASVQKNYLNGCVVYDMVCNVHVYVCKNVAGVKPAELWSLDTVSGEYIAAGQQLSHVLSRQRLKLNRCALTICLSRWAHPSNILGDGGVHFEPADCCEHLPLSFGASTPAQASACLPAISSATPHHVSASNRSRVPLTTRLSRWAQASASLVMVACTSILPLASSTSR